MQLRVSLLESQELLIGEILTVNNILEALAVFALVDHLQTWYSDVQFPKSSDLLIEVAILDIEVQQLPADDVIFAFADKAIQPILIVASLELRDIFLALLP